MFSNIIVSWKLALKCKIDLVNILWHEAFLITSSSKLKIVVMWLHHPFICFLSLNYQNHSNSGICHINSDRWYTTG